MKLTVTQMQILRRLSVHGPSSGRELTEGTSPKTISLLEKKGAVESSGPGCNRAVKHYTWRITDAGRQALKEVP